MKNKDLTTNHTNPAKGIKATRRDVLMGGLALGAASLTSSTAIAGALQGSVDVFEKQAIPDTPSQFRFACEEFHYGVRTKLDSIINAQHISHADTQAAIDSAHCPNCNKLIPPSSAHFQALSA